MDWALDATKRADQAYEDLTDRPSPMRSFVLKPNRLATKAFT